VDWLGHWFWAPIKVSENSAQTLVRVLGNIFRIALTIVLAAVGLLIWAIMDSSERTSALLSAQKAEQDKIQLSVKLLPAKELSNEKVCTKAYPLVVEVTNDSRDKALMSMSIELTAREPGSSTNKLNYYPDGRLEWDAIVLPKHSVIQCWSVKQEHRQLTYSGVPISYSMKLEPVAEWMFKEASYNIASN
jgi:hypothetical protein